MIIRKSIPLLEALDIKKGIICLVGTAEKDTLIHRLATLYSGRMGITSITPIPSFPKDMPAYQIIADKKQQVMLINTATKTYRIIAYAQSSEKKGTLLGIPSGLIEIIHTQAQFNLSVVRADLPFHHFDISNPIDKKIFSLPIGTIMIIPIISIAEMEQSLLAKTILPIRQGKGMRFISKIGIGNPIKPIYLAKSMVELLENIEGGNSTKIIPLISINKSYFTQEEQDGIITAELALSITHQFDQVVIAYTDRNTPFATVVSRY
ncbi:hypothetical protein [Candidatus Nitrosacidococcus tergens]|uniref:Selenium-dependent hydroxylase accessory protein YqeC n=1 Tax=Candidatus Nitrosacidococcus tergens TaxID=553981 RepID=A0A7G1Q927_9GAMM|nr:hypothetical protein [Candidatus Nitrosacidococcus tergens]CAB1275677.1 conserved protein of unknown function [Candidatus Nitrosacidococcus tergens]